MERYRGDNEGQDLIVSFRNDKDLDRCKSEYINRFNRAYDLFFNTPDQDARKPGQTTLSSLDYVFDNDEVSFAYSFGTAVAKLPYQEIVDRFEEHIAQDQDKTFPVITIRGEGKLPRLNPPISRKIGTAVHKNGLYLIRINFVLIPDILLQRSVEQIKVFLDKEDGPEIGEVWIGKKWFKSNGSTEISPTSDSRLLIPV